MVKHIKKAGEKEYKLTDKQFALFREEVKYWMEFYSMQDYKINVVKEETTQYRGWCSSGNLSDRVLDIGIASTWHEPIDDAGICYVAFHEATEALTMRIFMLATDLGYSITDLREECHTIINRLEAAIFTDYLTRKKGGK
jgi:hypothetical protein